MDANNDLEEISEEEEEAILQEVKREVEHSGVRVNNEPTECAREDIKIETIDQEIVTESTEVIASTNEPNIIPVNDVLKTHDYVETVKIMDN